MSVNGTWLTAGTALLDAHDRIIESNDEFASWARTSRQEPSLLIDVLSRICPEWRKPIAEFLRGSGTFTSLQLHDSTRLSWYNIERVVHNDTRLIRISRCLPPLVELSESAGDKFMSDASTRREVYARVLRAESQLKLLSGKWPGVLFTQRPDFTFSFVSEKIEEWTGISVESWGRRPQRFWDAIHDGDAAELQNQLVRCKAGEPVITTFRVRNVQTGKVTYIFERREAIRSSNGLILGYDGAWIDVTRQMIAEKRLSSAVWKETLAVLTMGLAHDFSNILAGILALAETYQTSVPPGSELDAGFGLIKKSSQQASQLVQRISSLHQGKVGQRNYYGANDLVIDTIEVTKKTVRRINVHTDFSREQLPLYVDPVEFRQVLVNLTLNAADAMSDGGDLYFKTALLEELPANAHVQGTMPNLPAVCIEVRDTGCGIAPEHLSQIFDPFFTTKPLNKGSGLGLYNARLFAEKHSAAISVESIENRGTTFQIWLPKANFTESERFQSELILGRKTVLVVESHGRNLGATAQCLRENGFYVATAESEKTAVELLHSPDYQFDAVMALVNGHNRLSPRLFNEIGRLKLPMKKIVQIYGSNEDDHDAALLDRADLVIGSDTPAGEIATKLRDALSKLSAI